MEERVRKDESERRGGRVGGGIWREVERGKGRGREGERCQTVG